jgi:hypothetical protein
MTVPGRSREYEAIEFAMEGATRAARLRLAEITFRLLRERGVFVTVDVPPEAYADELRAAIADLSPEALADLRALIQETAASGVVEGEA